MDCWEHCEDALEAAKNSYRNGMSVTINKLGEYNTSEKVICNTIDEYKLIMSSFKKWDVKGSISVKPTQVGMMRSKKECIENLQTLIKAAALTHTFLWIDMESADHTDDTMGIYYSLFARYERLGIALQANLRRTEDDLSDLLSMGAKVRLVKGAYRENAKIAFRSKERVDRNYELLMNMLFEKGNEFAIATHDPKMIQTAVKLSKEFDRKFEFQMLRGISDKTKAELVKDGFTLSEYIPYGTNWLPYSIRRLKERKRNLLLLGSAFVSRFRA